MPSARADRHHVEAGRPRPWVAGLVLCLLAPLLAGAGSTTPVPLDRAASAAAAPAGAPARARAATSLLDRLAHRLRHGTRTQLAVLAAPGEPTARRALLTLRANVRRLRIRDLDLGYLGTVPHARHRRTSGPAAWTARVRLRWRLAGYDRHDSVREISMRLVATSRGARFVTVAGTPGAGLPLWLLAPVTVRRTPRALVVAAAPASTGTTARFAGLATRAVADVRRVLPRWRGALVVEVPSRGLGLAAVLGGAPGAYDDLAAVTTTADGSLSRSAPAHVYLNPRVLPMLGPRAAQVVTSHEATHVATGAAVSVMPEWLLEGFADYVALKRVDLAASTLAGQALARVRRVGPPRQLPRRRDFDPGSHTVGASYEVAWLACRLFAHGYGEGRLVRLYREADRTSSTSRAFAGVGVDEKAFVRAWRRQLRRLAQ